MAGKKIQISKIQKSRPIVGETGTHHYQIYLEFDRTRTLSYLKKLTGLEGCHAEIAADPMRAYAYCTKDDGTYISGSRFEWGARVGQGKRSDLLGVKRLLDEGASMLDIAENHFSQFIRYEKGFTSYLRLKQPKRNFKSKVILIVGPAGVGKTTAAWLIAQRLGSVYKAPQPKGMLYYDGYANEDVLFIDEMNGNKMKPEDFNALCDAFPTLLPTHGNAGLQMTSKYIVITSNYLPNQWWKTHSKPQQAYQIERRIDGYIYVFRNAWQQALYEKQTGQVSSKLGHWPIFAGNHPAFNPGSPASAPVAPTLLVGSQSIPIDVDEVDTNHQSEPHWYQQAQEPIEWMDASNSDY